MHTCCSCSHFCAVDCQDGFRSCDGLCFPDSWWCDGETDCDNGSDESNCTSSRNGGEAKQQSSPQEVGSEGKDEEEGEEETSESNGEEGSGEGENEDTEGVMEEGGKDNKIRGQQSTSPDMPDSEC